MCMLSCVIDLQLVHAAMLTVGDSISHSAGGGSIELLMLSSLIAPISVGLPTRGDNIGDPMCVKKANTPNSKQKN